MPPGFARHGIRVLSGRRVELLHDISEGNPAVRQGSSMLGHCQLDFADTLTGIAAAAEVALEDGGAQVQRLSRLKAQPGQAAKHGRLMGISAFVEALVIVPGASQLLNALVLSYGANPVLESQRGFVR